MPVLMSTPSPTHRAMSSCSPSERLRLRPWLEKKIKEQSIPGLEWLDENATIVKIPWKHAARHGWTRDKDASLFKEWAIHTKKYNPATDEPKANPKIWKANFRCAINSLPDIEELKDQGKTKGNDAFKVYRLNPKKPKKNRTVSETATSRKAKGHKSSRLRSTKCHSRKTSSQLSITCENVSLKVFPCSQPPTYESVVGFPSRTECCPLPPVSFGILPSYSTHVNSRISPLNVPTPCSTPCSTVSSPMSTTTPVSATTTAFPYPPSSFAMPNMHPIHPGHIKQENLPSPYNDDGMSDSSGDMTDEELIEMVAEMRNDSPLNSPSPTTQSSIHDDSFINGVSNGNEWTMTSTSDDKQFFSNIVTQKGENVTTPPFQSSIHYPPTSLPASSFCGYSLPPTHIKTEIKTEPAPCLGGDPANCYDANVDGFGL